MALPFRLPSLPLTIAIWRSSNWAATIPPLNPPDLTAAANLTPGRRIFEQSVAPMSYLLLLKDTDIRFSESGVFASWPADDPDLVEVPQGSGRYYVVADVESVGRGFANEHQEAAVMKQSPWPVSGPAPTSGILLEDGSDLLLEDDTNYLLE